MASDRWCDRTGGVMLPNYVAGVTIASLSKFQQQPGSSLIQLDEALIAPTVGVPWLFDHIGL